MGEGVSSSWESYTRRLVSRVGDEERHKVAELLGEHLAHGRLTQEEFDERVAAALSARTAGQLGALLADLPGGTRQPDPRKSKRAWVMQIDVRKPLLLGGALCAVFLVALVLDMLIAGDQGFAAWVTGLLGLGLGWLVATVFPRLRDDD